MSRIQKGDVERVIFSDAGTVQSLRNNAVPYGICWSRDFDDTCEEASKRSETNSNPAFRYLASVAGRNISIFQTRVTIDHNCGAVSEPFQIIQSYHDPSEEEELFCCVFAGESRIHPPFLLDEALLETLPLSSDIEKRSSQTYQSNSRVPIAQRVDNPLGSPTTDTKGHKKGFHQLLCVAGKMGFVKVIDTERQLLLYCLRCLDEIWDLQRSRANEWMIIAASKDTSARIWNLSDGGSLMYILSGHGGHRDAVITAAWHQSGKWVATAGIDTRICVWNVERCISKEVEKKTPETFSFVQSRDSHVQRVHFPAFCTDLVHNCAIDSLAFVGNLILSKSYDDCIELWLPCGLFDELETVCKSTKSNLQHLRHFSIRFTQPIWYVKCAVDPSYRFLAAGNDRGEVHVWEIFATDTDHPRQVMKTCKGSHASAIRDVKFSDDGSTLAATNDGGMVMKWDLIDINMSSNP